MEIHVVKDPIFSNILIIETLNSKLCSTIQYLIRTILGFQIFLFVLIMLLEKRSPDEFRCTSAEFSPKYEVFPPIHIFSAEDDNGTPVSCTLRSNILQWYSFKTLGFLIWILLKSMKVFCLIMTDKKTSVLNTPGSRDHYQRGQTSRLWRVLGHFTKSCRRRAKPTWLSINIVMFFVIFSQKSDVRNLSSKATKKFIG